MILNVFNFMLNSFVTKQLNFLSVNNFKFYFLTSNIFFSFFFKKFFFFFINSNITPLNLTNKQFFIKKNLFFFSKILKFFRNLIFFKKLIFKKKFKTNKFFKFIFLKKYYKFRKFQFFNQNYNFTPKFYFYHFKFFKKNWFPLISGAISPFSWEFTSNKKLVEKNLNFNIIKLFPNFYNRYIKKKLIKKFPLFIKSLYINNFFYLNKLFLNLKNLTYFLKLNNLSFSKNFSNPLAIKPYLFTNGGFFYKKSFNFSNIFIYQKFKLYFKIFNLQKKFMKKISKKFKKNNNILFKKLNFSGNNYLTPQFLNKPDNPQFFNLTKQFFLTQFINSNLFKIKKITTKTPIKVNLVFNFFLKKKIKNYKTKKFYFFYKKLSTYFKIHSFRLFKKFLFYYNTRFKKINFWNFYLKFEKKSNFSIKTFKKLKLKKNNFTLNTIPFYFGFFFLSKLKFNNTNFFFKKIKLPDYGLSVFNQLDPYFFKKNNLKIFSKELTKFIFLNYGFVYLTTTRFLTSHNAVKPISNIKKNLYTFSYKNEIQRFILRRYSKIQPVNSFYRSNSFFNSNFKNELLFNKENSINFYHTTLNSFFKKSSNISSLVFKKISSPNWPNYSNKFIYHKKLNSENWNFSIKRVKFKPGYMNLWRNAREALKLSLNLKTCYQSKLTSFLLKYNKFIRFEMFLNLEMKLDNVLIKSRLLPDWNSVNLFISNNLVYLNGFLCSNNLFQTYVGDFIQLVVSLKYYIIYKWFLNWSLRKKIRLKLKARKKLTISSSLEDKTRSYSLPKWILFSKNVTDDVIKYIEVDYFTLSIMIIYEPFLWSDINIYNIVDNKFSILNLYNWKYIT